eukprot:Skav205847  [mRNA]  locus=scaffold160:727173:730492:+ [translate_table: standard]
MAVASRTATVKALIDAGVWGANGHNFKQVRPGNATGAIGADGDGLRWLMPEARYKDQIALAAFSESFDAGARVATQGDPLAAIYFVVKGGLAVMAGGEVKADGKFSGGSEVRPWGGGRGGGSGDGYGNHSTDGPCHREFSVPTRWASM